MSQIRVDDGFTVVELVMAAAIMLIIVVGVMGAIMYSSQASAMTQRRSEALTLANQQIELARNLPFDDVATVVPANGLPSGKIPSPTTSGPYTMTTNIAYGTYGASPAARYKTMSVVVSWTLPIPGSVTLSSIIAGASGTQDYNFGGVTLTVVDGSSHGFPGVTVTLTDVNNRTYTATTDSSGKVEFDYVPSGNITFSASYPGYAVVNLPTSPTCVANTVTNYGPAQVVPLLTAVIRCLSSTGTPIAGLNVNLTGATNLGTKVSDANGYVTYADELLSNGSYTISNPDSYYSVTSSNPLNTGTSDINVNTTWALQPATVNVTGKSSGTVYVWNPDSPGTPVTSKTLNGSLKATISLTNSNTSPKTYYFTKTATYATTNPLTVTAGQTYALTVN